MSSAHPTSETFPANVGAALADSTLRGALARATDLFAERRASGSSMASICARLRCVARCGEESAKQTGQVRLHSSFTSMSARQECCS